VTVNPVLHIAMHEIVANQLWANDPPEMWETAVRLLDAGYERHEVFAHACFSGIGRGLRGAGVHDPRTRAGSSNGTRWQGAVSTGPGDTGRRATLATRGVSALFVRALRPHCGAGRSGSAVGQAVCGGNPASASIASVFPLEPGTKNR
jgi:hypothetical protein